MVDPIWPWDLCCVLHELMQEGWTARQLAGVEDVARRAVCNSPEVAKGATLTGTTVSRCGGRLCGTTDTKRSNRGFGRTQPINAHRIFPTGTSTSKTSGPGSYWANALEQTMNQP